MRIRSKMKILFICIFTVLFISCSKGSSAKNSESTTEYFERSYYVNMAGMVMEDSCFPEITEGMLKLYNNQTKKTNVFCFDPTCTHPAPSMGSVSSCFAWNHQAGECFPMLSSKQLYFYEKENFMKSKLIRADKDTKNQKTIVEFDGNAVQALCSDNIIITVIEDEYQFNDDGEFEKKEKKKIYVYATNVIDGKTEKLFEDEQFNGKISDCCFINGKFNFVYVVLDMSEDEMNDMYEKYGMDEYEEQTELILSKTTTEIISVDVGKNETIYRKKAENGFVSTAVSEKYCAFIYSDESQSEDVKGKTVIYDLEKDEKSEVLLFGPEIFECGDCFLIRSGKCDLTLIEAGTGKTLKEQSYDSFLNIRTVIGKSVYYITGNDNSDMEIYIIGIDDFMAGKLENAVKV